MRARVLVVSLALLATGCSSLPLPDGVQRVGDVAGGQPVAPPLQVIPPGPVAGATPVQTVLGFLGAQASSDGDRAIARQFLTSARSRSWRDEAGVQVYDPARLSVEQVSSGETAVVRVSARVTGRVREDGSYLARAVDVSEDYRLVRVGADWRVDGNPDGLQLTAADLRRAFTSQAVHYLAPPAADGTRRVVPDLVLLPASADLARALVTRLLGSPSQALEGSVTSAVPAGARLVRVAAASSGVVTVELAGARQWPSGAAAQDLSAQLVWTLRALGPSFRGLRLLVDGRPFQVPGESGVQDAEAWDAYDPQGLGPSPAYYFVSERRLRASVELPTSPATAGEVGDGRAVAVDAVAVTPDRTRVALLEDSRSVTQVRIGPLRGSAFPVVARGRALTSPTWGSGALGLWLLRDGREVVRVADGGLRAVPVPALRAQRISALALSRDGVRVALVVGGRLLVGRVELLEGSPRVVGLVAVQPALRAVRAVAWATSTQLVVAGELERGPQVLRVAVDGSSVQALSTPGLRPSQLAASPGGVVLVAAGRLYAAEAAGPFRLVVPATVSAPAYPG